MSQSHLSYVRRGERQASTRLLDRVKAVLHLDTIDAARSALRGELLLPSSSEVVHE